MMDVETVETIAEWVLLNLPRPITDALDDIEIAIIDTVADAPDLELEPDARGCFFGYETQGEDDADEEGKPPVGVIVLVASALVDDEDVQKTLFHEIGHAVGLSEEEVADLGLE